MADHVISSGSLCVNEEQQRRLELALAAESKSPAAQRAAAGRQPFRAWSRSVQRQSVLRLDPKETVFSRGSRRSRRATIAVLPLRHGRSPPARVQGGPRRTSLGLSADPFPGLRSPIKIGVLPSCILRGSEICSVGLGGCVVFPGRLREGLQFWEGIGVSSFVLFVIREGFRLPLVAGPQRKVMSKHGSCVKHDQFVDEAVRELLVSTCVREVSSEKVDVCSSLGVHDSGKNSDILDLRYLNKYLHAVRFKFEDIKTASQLYEKGDFIVTFYLKSGYHHKEIDHIYHGFLAFAWKSKVYVFTVLCFGLSEAPWVFTKVTMSLVRVWRVAGIRCMLHVEDGSGAGASQDEA